MKYVKVKFCEYVSKVYLYKTNLNLKEGYTYDIVADNIQTYSNPVKVVEISNQCPRDVNIPIEMIRTITSARCVDSPQRPGSEIKVVNFNEKKGITVVKWEDGDVTKVTCSKDDVFDREKGLALCYMKKFGFDNRGCFNETLKKYCREGE